MAGERGEGWGEGVGSRGGRKEREEETEGVVKYRGRKNTI
jgi:hypothetical protein